MENLLLNFKPVNVSIIENNNNMTLPINLVKEEALSIRIQGKPYLIVMRTPGNEKEHAAGICLAEGIIAKLGDISSVGLCDGEYSNIVTITVTEQRRAIISKILNRNSYISNSSCGICGKNIIEEIITEIKPFENNSLINTDLLTSKISNINSYQPLRRKTRASHCAAIYDKNSSFLSSAEDVGRHNALDKAIGWLLLRETLSEAHIITLSSRISYELVQKAARARIPIIAAVSRPTSLAVELAIKLNMTLVTLSPNNGLIVYCNNHNLCV